MVARQLLKPRIGSIAEDEVASLFRRIAFMNRPLQPDDVGADFVCSVAHAKEGKTKGKTKSDKLMPMLYSGSWFLLSVKSGEAKVGLDRSSGHFEWFLNLEIPFFVVQVEDSEELEITVYHTLQQIAAVQKLPDTVSSVEFLCETSELYASRSYRIDQLDVIQVEKERAKTWLGPPLLRLKRKDLLDLSFSKLACDLLQKVCHLHTTVKHRGISGMDTGVMWETNSSIETPVKSYSIPSLVKSTRTTVEEIDQVMSSMNQDELIQQIWLACNPLFNFYDVMRKMEEGESSITITSDEVFRKRDKK